MTKTLIKGGIIVNEGRSQKGDLLIDDGVIAESKQGELQAKQANSDTTPDVIDASGCYVLPGIIDTHVHFRDPGLTDKADIESESRAAAYGGVTSYLDMPNTVPQTTTIDTLKAKYSTAAQKSHINYGFFFGATNDNHTLFSELNTRQVPGIKLFMGSSTGNMLVDKYASLLKVFEKAQQAGLPVVAHCEDTDTINRNMEQMKKAYGEDPMVALHPVIRSEEACFESSALAVQLARHFGTRLHVAHISTAKELDLFSPSTLITQTAITAEACIAHLLFTSDDYLTKGTLIKCNPAVKTAADRQALRQALTDGRIATIATDHAPHMLEQKQGGCARAASGMPMIQFSLVAMLGLVDEGVLSIERLVELMAHRPADLFDMHHRGYLRKGYHADITIVRPQSPWTLTKDQIQSKCGWSPLEGTTFNWRVEHTFCNGQHIYDNGVFDDSVRGMELEFRTS